MNPKFEELLSNADDEALSKLEITDTKIRIPVDINLPDYVTLFQDELNTQTGNQDEKMIMAVLVSGKKEPTSVKDVLNEYIRFEE